MDEDVILQVEDLVPPGSSLQAEVARAIADAGGLDRAHAGMGELEAGRMYLWTQHLTQAASHALAQVTCRRGCGPEIEPLMVRVAHPLGISVSSGLDFVYDAAVDTLADALTHVPLSVLTQECLADLRGGDHPQGACLADRSVRDLVPVVMQVLTGTAADLVAATSSPLEDAFIEGMYREYAQAYPLAEVAELVNLVHADPRLDAMPDDPDPRLLAAEAGGWCDEQYAVAPDIVELAAVAGYPVKATARALLAVALWLEHRAAADRDVAAG